MSSVWLRRITTLCLFITALSGSESSGVVLRNVGGQITIQCKSSESNHEYLNLNKGLNEEFQVMVKDGNSGKNTIVAQYTGRLQSNGVMPNVDILITNLTTEDTGPYWCVYKRFDFKSKETKTMRGTGSVLLVVTDTMQQCDLPNKVLVTGSVVISAAVLLGVILTFFIWFIFKKKTLRTSRSVPINDVYEDMRGTMRR